MRRRTVGPLSSDRLDHIVVKVNAGRRRQRTGQVATLPPARFKEVSMRGRRNGHLAKKKGSCISSFRRVDFPGSHEVSGAGDDLPLQYRLLMDMLWVFPVFHCNFFHRLILEKKVIFEDVRVVVMRFCFIVAFWYRAPQLRSGVCIHPYAAVPMNQIRDYYGRRQRCSNATSLDKQMHTSCLYDWK